MQIFGRGNPIDDSYWHGMNAGTAGYSYEASIGGTVLYPFTMRFEAREERRPAGWTCYFCNQMVDPLLFQCPHCAGSRAMAR